MLAVTPHGGLCEESLCAKRLARCQAHNRYLASVACDDLSVVTVCTPFKLAIALPDIQLKEIKDMDK